MNHRPGDPVCIEHVRGAIYTREVHLCPLCRRCPHCGASDDACKALADWDFCCADCAETLAYWHERKS